MGSKRSIGNMGEEIAVKYLTDMKHAVILARNFTVKCGEIDIVARIGETVCFVEVKLRTSLDPHEAITQAKMRSLTRAARLYLQMANMTDCYARFDAALITFPDSIEYIENAFDAVD